jgi:hypothetical protein
LELHRALHRIKTLILRNWIRASFAKQQMYWAEDTCGGGKIVVRLVKSLCSQELQSKRKPA